MNIPSSWSFPSSTGERRLLHRVVARTPEPSPEEPMEHEEADAPRLEGRGAESGESRESRGDDVQVTRRGFFGRFRDIFRGPRERPLPEREDEEEEPVRIRFRGRDEEGSPDTPPPEPTEPAKPAGEPEKRESPLAPAGSPEERLHSLTERMLLEIQRLRPAFGFTRGAKQRAILRYVEGMAKRLVDDEMYATDGRIRTVLKKAERELIVLRVAEQLVRNMRGYLEAKKQEYEEDRKGYLGWWKRLFASKEEKGKNPDRAKAKANLEWTERQLQDIGGVEEKFRAREEPHAEAGEKLDQARQKEQQFFERTEEVLKGMSALKLTPYEIRCLFAEHMQGSSRLMDHLNKAMPGFFTFWRRSRRQSIAELKKIAQELRQPKVRGYRLLAVAEEDRDILTKDERMHWLKGHAQPGMQMALYLGRAFQGIVSVTGREKTVLKLRDARGAHEFLLETRTGKLETPDHQLEYDLYDKKYEFSLNPSGSLPHLHARAA